MKKNFFLLYLVLLKFTLSIENGHYYYNGIIDNNCSIEYELFVCSQNGQMILPEDYSEMILINKSPKEIVIFVTDFFNAKSLKVSLFKKEEKFSNIVYVNKDKFFIELEKSKENLILIVKTNNSNIGTSKIYTLKNDISKTQIDAIDKLENNKLFFIDEINLF